MVKKRRVYIIMNKICTSIEQSKKLIELGIDVNTADIIYNILDESYIRHDTPIDKYHKPAWSLTALMRLIPNFNMFKRTIECRIETTNHLIDKACDPIDATFEMVCWLLENGKI